MVDLQGLSQEIHGIPGDGLYRDSLTRSMGDQKVFTGTVSREPWETRWSLQGQSHEIHEMPGGGLYRDSLMRSMGYQVVVFKGTVSQVPWETRLSL